MIDLFITSKGSKNFYQDTSVVGGEYHFIVTLSSTKLINCLPLGIETENIEQITPIRVFADIWFSSINKSKAKSARSILPRPSNEDDNSPPK